MEIKPPTNKNRSRAVGWVWTKHSYHLSYHVFLLLRFFDVCANLARENMPVNYLNKKQWFIPRSSPYLWF